MRPEAAIDSAGPAPPFLEGRWAAEGRLLVRALSACRRLLVEAGRPGPEDRARKADRSPVTSLDFAAQAVILGLLEAEFPDDAFVAEEDGSQMPRNRAGSWLQAAARAARAVRPEAGPDDVRRWLARRPDLGRRFWTIDPIDGTKGLVRGGQYVSAVALVEDGSVVLGGLACPAYDLFGPQGCLALALRGAGAWARSGAGGAWRRLEVSDGADFPQRRLIRSVEASRSSDGHLASIRNELHLDAPEVRLDSQVKYLALASGEGQLVVRLPRRGGRRAENTWDHAAGTLLASEAGARVTDLRGAPLDFGAGARLERNLGVLAAVPGLHEPALRAAGNALEGTGQSSPLPT